MKVNLDHLNMENFLKLIGFESYMKIFQGKIFQGKIFQESCIVNLIFILHQRTR